MNETAITVEPVGRAPLDTVWAAWTQPERVTQWNFASDDWHCPRAVNDLRPAGPFPHSRAARDGSVAFAAEGTNPPEMQRAGWQAIVENFRRRVESPTPT